jgi:hypothetical protein
MEYAQTPYKNYAAINMKLQLLGMRHFRDEINDTDPSFVEELNRIGELGYSLCGLIAGEMTTHLEAPDLRPAPWCP